jgi:lipoate-protein ligase A
LGRTGKEEDDLFLDKVKQDGIPLLRRSSGGGTVLQGKGCLNYSLILSKQRDPRLSDIRKSYEFILRNVLSALNAMDVDAVFRPTSDMVLRNGELKFSGNAQRRSKNFILHHGTILYGFDLGKIGAYLRIPKDIPDYRRGRPHDQFTANVPLNASDFKKSLGKCFAIEMQDDKITKDEQICLSDFIASKDVYVKF